ncbi:MAG: hypothetical protein KC492_22780, partial [Myxococcales bacterium]|nr:hypothetical protein [Myxococcales bacterium]
MAEVYTPPTGSTKRQGVLRRVSALRSARASWIPHWRELSMYQQPRLGRFLVTDISKGEKRHQAIYDRTAMGALRTLAAGMQSGMTSPARPWFRLELADRDLMERGEVKAWLFRTGTLLRNIFARSNTYRALHTMYGELGLFGTACSIVVPNFDNVIHHYPLTAGEYALGQNDLDYVDTVSREFQMTVGQMVQRFGKEACSTTVQNLYSRGAFDSWVPLVHLIEPRRDRDLTKKDAKHMAWASCYLEAGGNEDKFLSESGFKRFPALAPRWEVTSGDTYGNSPGMEALGDVKQLQHQQLRKSQAIDYKVNPPLQVPPGYKDNAKARLPGGIMVVPSTGPDGGVRSA